jgi:hypothetical protein
MRPLTQVTPTRLLRLRYLVGSIGLLLTLFLFHERAVADHSVVTDQSVRAKASFTEGNSTDELRRDLAQIDQKAAEGMYGEASVLVGRNIKARDIYKNYLERAEGISGQLLSVRPRLTETFTLQQLGAFTQSLSAENLRFKGTFTHGEEKFQTYQLIQTAIHNLEDASNYWRIANRYRSLYRGSLREHMEDDQILKLKIQTALNAIDELKSIVHTRESLSKDLTDAY